jgi:putative transposase
MARPVRIEYPGAFYHITARGNERKDIFKSRSDREQFLSYLQSATERRGSGLHFDKACMCECVDLTLTKRQEDIR